MNVNEIKQNAEEKVSKLKEIDWKNVGKRVAIIVGACALGGACAMVITKHVEIDQLIGAAEETAETAGDVAQVVGEATVA